MKKGFNLVLEEQDLIELIRILLDGDAEGALVFLTRHFKGKARELLEGGWKVMIEVPGAGITQVSGNLFQVWGLAMFLDAITLTRTLPCLAEPVKIIVIGQPGRSLSDVIPYLATLPGVIAYNPETLTLTFRRPRGFMTLYPDKVYITQVSNVEEGLQLLKNLTEAINETWEQRAELKAMTTARRAPRWLDIWALLPQTNCKQCGEATCMAFAAALLQQTRGLAECLPFVSDPAFGDRRSTLEAML